MLFTLKMTMCMPLSGTLCTLYSDTAVYVCTLYSDTGYTLYNDTCIGTVSAHCIVISCTCIVTLYIYPL